VKIIQCQRCDVDIIGNANRRYCRPCGVKVKAESRKASKERIKAHNAALRLKYQDRSRAMAGEGGE
jgi:hypothetical protein